MLRMVIDVTEEQASQIQRLCEEFYQIHLLWIHLYPCHYDMCRSKL